MTSVYHIEDALLDRLVAEFMDQHTIGILLTGSHARGDATPFSDVDLVRFVPTLPEADEARYTLIWRDGRLISLSCATVTAKLAELARPETAIWTVPGLRQARLLLDRDGSLAALLQAAHNFRWEPLQPAADAYASYELMGLAEEAHKVLAGLHAGDPMLALYGASGLVFGLARAIAIQRGTLICTENTFFRQVQAAVGEQSAWTNAFRRAIGLEMAPPGVTAALWRAQWSLRLYAETATLLTAILQPQHRPVIQGTLARIRNCGLPADVADAG